MLMDLLEQSIAAMKEIYELEKASNDVQKQEKNDRIFSSVVGPLRCCRTPARRSVP